VDTTKFITYYKNKISKEIDNIKDAFEQGRIPKENYDASVGELKGLRTAKNLLQESAKYIENNDNEI
tara:strand:+ start:253 stop:453 length:201 start_codon:yes stop_codon:yes gene_type:complete